MANKYFLKPKLGAVKQAFYLEDEAGSVVYEGKMTKFSLFGASPFEFINHITNKIEEHKIGKTITIEQGGNSIFLFNRLTSVFSSFIHFHIHHFFDYFHGRDVGKRSPAV